MNSSPTITVPSLYWEGTRTPRTSEFTNFQGSSYKVVARTASSLILQPVSPPPSQPLELPDARG